MAEEPRAAVFQGDLYEAERNPDSPGDPGLIDFDRPVAALLLAAVLHFVPDGDDPLKLIRQYTDRLAPGSYLVLSHAGADQV
ncbi:SAM-dependent methyltransferase, partial [Kitasatospora albolonga]|uniref:SAM-dependent methyltransferase n=1 Tax=Kitasatospora albolonga TaxID=68173 RepID=UPI003CD069CA